MCIRDRVDGDSVDSDKTQFERALINSKISKITTRSTLASAYIEEQKTRGKDEITENLGKKMYGAITSFKEKYTMIQPNREQLLMSIKI